MKLENILITGATGFLGQSLVPMLIGRGKKVYVLSRDKLKVHQVFDSTVIAVTFDDVSQNNYDVVINLAGAGILDRPWSQSRVIEIFASRVDYSKRLFEHLNRCSQKPQLLLNASAIGYYGFWQDEILDEDSSFNDGIVHQLCSQWEQQARKSGIEKVCCLRFGVILGKGGGALKRMLLPFKLGLGGPIGHGQQWFSWVHIKDVLNIINKLIDRKFFFDTLNITSSSPVRQEVFAKVLAKTLNRPAILRTPQWVLNLVFRQGADLLTKSQRVVSSRLDGVKYKFIYEDIEAALKEVVN